MATTPQLFFQAARQAGQPDIVTRFSAILGTMLAPHDEARPALLAPDVERQRIKNQGAIQLLKSWMAEDAALSPVEQQAALAEWEQLQQLLDEEYLAESHLLP